MMSLLPIVDLTLIDGQELFQVDQSLMVSWRRLLLIFASVS